MNTNDGPSSTHYINTGDSEPDSSKADLVVEVSSNGEDIGVGDVSEILVRAELDLACSSEKLVNLNVLMMNVATRESDFEAFVSEKEHALDDSVHKALEFDLLSGILHSEAVELDSFIATVRTDILNVREMISSCRYSGETFVEIEEKLRDSEESLRQSHYQMSDIKMQCARFQRALSSLGSDENWKYDEGAAPSEDGQPLNECKNLNMQTAEQQRHILRMLEKSLSRELDLDKKLNESKQCEEDLKSRILCVEQEAFFIQEEATDTFDRLFEAENAAEVTLGISKDLLGQLQIAQFNLNGSAHREAQLNLKLENVQGKLIETENSLKNAESELKSLEKTNMGLNEGIKVCYEKVNSFERQLRESDLKLQHAVASCEASEEKQNMLNSSIQDMEILIEDLKLKVLRAESQVDSAEDTCVVLSETNAALNEELSSLRSRLECLKGYLNQAEERKIAAVKDIGLRKKLMTELLMQLAIERKRLHEQISSLVIKNKTLEGKLHQTKKASSLARNKYGGASKEQHLSESSASASDSEAMTRKTDNFSKTVVAPAEAESEFAKVRRIDAGALSFKHVYFALVLLFISSAVYILQSEKCPSF